MVEAGRRSKSDGGEGASKEVSLASILTALVAEDDRRVTVMDLSARSHLEHSAQYETEQHTPQNRAHVQQGQTA